MIRSALILASSLVFSVMARESTDVIIMTNGDRLTCKIKQLEAGVLYVSVDYMSGDASIDWKKVAQIESNQSFLVKTQAGSVFQGTLKTAKANAHQPSQLEIVGTAAAKPVSIDMLQVVDVRQTSEKSLQRWSGSISSGSSYSKGNNAAHYNIAFQTLYQQERWTAQTNVSSNLAANSGATTSTRNSGTITAYHLLPWDKYFYEGLGEFLQSSVQGITLQTSLGAGVGRFIKDTSRARIAVMGGLAWQGTHYQEKSVAQPVQNVAAGLVGVQVNLFEFSRTNLNVSAAVFPALSEPGRLRLSTNASYFVKLFGKVSWNLTFYGNWDTEPPPGFSSSDYGSTSGLSWSFGK